MYKLYKMQRTLKADVKTQQTANGTDVSEGGIRMSAECHRIEVIMRQLKNLLNRPTKKINPC